jgi:hypothetical protein
MDEQNKDVNQDSSPETVEQAKTEAQAQPAEKPAEKTVPYDRFKEVVEENKILKSQPKVKGALEVEDFIDISASLEGLDSREKERLAREHKLTGRPLSEIRKDEDFQLWQQAYRAKVEKEAQALAPSTAQAEADRPKSFVDRLKGASLAEKEELLAQAGLYKAPKRRPDQTHIGTQR